MVEAKTLPTAIIKTWEGEGEINRILWLYEASGDVTVGAYCLLKSEDFESAIASYTAHLLEKEPLTHGGYLHSIYPEGFEIAVERHTGERTEADKAPVSKNLAWFDYFGLTPPDRPEERLYT